MPTEEPVLLYNVSERQLRRMAPKRYTEVFVPNEMEGKADVIGFQDTTDIERYCHEMRKEAPDFKVTPNKVPGKWLHAARIPKILLDQRFGPKWSNASRPEKDRMIKLILRDHPEFAVQKRSTLGL